MPTIHSPYSVVVYSMLVNGVATLIPECWNALLSVLSHISMEPLLSATASIPSFDHAIAVIDISKFYIRMVYNNGIIVIAISDF